MMQKPFALHNNIRTTLISLNNVRATVFSWIPHLPFHESGYSGLQLDA